MISLPSFFSLHFFFSSLFFFLSLSLSISISVSPLCLKYQDRKRETANVKPETILWVLAKAGVCIVVITHSNKTQRGARRGHAVFSEDGCLGGMFPVWCRPIFLECSSKAVTICNLVPGGPSLSGDVPVTSCRGRSTESRSGL